MVSVVAKSLSSEQGEELIQAPSNEEGKLTDVLNDAEYSSHQMLTEGEDSSQHLPHNASIVTQSTDALEDPEVTEGESSQQVRLFSLHIIWRRLKLLMMKLSPRSKGVCLSVSSSGGDTFTNMVCNSGDYSMVLQEPANDVVENAQYCPE